MDIGRQILYATSNKQLLEAASEGDTERARSLLENGAPVNAICRYIQTSTRLAAENGHMETTAVLIAENVDVNATDNLGRTPLHLAAENGHTKTVELLIEKGADVNATDNLGRTPLHLAAEKGHTKTAELLIEKGADVNATDRSAEAWTPLRLARIHGHTETEELLKTAMERQKTEAVTGGGDPLGTVPNRTEAGFRRGPPGNPLPSRVHQHSGQARHGTIG